MILKKTICLIIFMLCGHLWALPCYKSPDKALALKLHIQKIEENSKFYYNLNVISEFKKRYKQLCSSIIPKEIVRRIKKIERNIIQKKKSCSNISNVKPIISKNRNQGKIGWCYAYAASDLLSYKINKKVSSTYLAVLSNKNDITKVFKRNFNRSYAAQESGITYDTLKLVLDSWDNSICLEKDAPSQDYSIFQVDFIIRGVEFFFDQYDEIRRSFFSMSRSNESLEVIRMNDRVGKRLFYKGQKFRKFVVKVYNELFSKHTIMQDAFPNVDFYEFIDILKTTSRNSIYRDLVMKTCEGKKYYLPKDIIPKSINSLFNDKEEMILKLNTLLTNKNILEVSYYSSILNDTEAKLTDRHSSLIVGRRFNDLLSECEFLIQNSWGDKCNIKSKLHECEKGRIWIREKFLKKSLIGLTWLE